MTFKRVISIIILSTVFFSFNFKMAYLMEEDKEIKESDFSVIVVEDDNYNTYFNYAKGYSLKYPNTYEVDESLSFVKDVFYDENTKIEVYYDNFENTINNSHTYINYGNRHILVEDEFIEKELEAHIDMETHYVHLLKWKRPKFKILENDKNYYLTAEIVKNKNEVYTVFIKSAYPLENYMNIIESFNFIEKTAEYPSIEKFNSKRNMDFNRETEEFIKEYLEESSKMKWGIFEHTAPLNMNVLNGIEEELDYKFKFLLKYQNLDSNLSLEELQNASKDDRYLELTLQTSLYNGDNTNINYRILNGEFDDFFNRYAQFVKEFGKPVLFRLNNEMNGDWCTYSSYYMAKDTDLYKAIWKHVYKIFEENNVDNAIWVWNPNNLDLPGFKWNHYLNYYPGDEYVDVIGLTAYNTGTYYPGEKWIDFDSLYSDLYSEYESLFDFPFIITEFGCNSVGGDKVAWIEDMFSKIDKYDKIKIAIWFNGIDRDFDGSPARIYRLDENEEVIKVFKEGLSKYE